MKGEKTTNTADREQKCAKQKVNKEKSSSR